MRFTDTPVLKRATFLASLFFATLMVSLNFIVDGLSDIAWYGNLLIAPILALSTFAYLYDKLPAWAGYALGVLISAFLLALVFISDSDYGMVASFIVLPSVVFLTYPWRAGVAWSIVFLITLVYALQLSDTIPETMIADSIRHAFVGAFVLQAGVSGIWHYVHLNNQRRLSQARERIKELERMLSMCMYCRKIHLDGEWVVVEKYLKEKSQTDVSHGICPTCREEQLAEFLAENESASPENP